MDRFRVYANLATLANGLVGVGAVLYTLAGNKLWGMLLVVCGVGFDGLDGLFSRKSARPSGAFGRVADSVADAVTFGLAPAALVAVHTDQATSWAPFESVSVAVGALVLALAVGRLVYFTVRGYHHRDFVGAPTPQTAIAIVLVGLLFDRPAFLGTNPPALLVAVGALAVLMVLPVPFPKIRRGARLRAPATATALALVLALVPLQFVPAVGSPLYLAAAAATAVSFGGVGAYYLVGPFTVPRPPQGSP